jgi:hypothetical protein
VAKCSAKPHLAILCWTLAVFRFLCNLVVIATSLTTPTVAEFDARWQWIVTTALVNEACVDFLIATSLCYFLMKSRRQSIHKRWRFFFGFFLVKSQATTERLNFSIAERYDCLTDSLQ